MLRDFNILPSNYVSTESNLVEVNTEIAEVIQQLNMLFLTDKEDVLLQSDFGCNLENYLFKTTFSEEVISSEIKNEIDKYVYSTENVTYKVNTKFLTWEHDVCMQIQIDINNKNESTSITYYA